jgi:hypothetical protein
MKSFASVILAALAAKEVAGHALFQDLWVDGVDMISLPFLVLDIILDANYLSTDLSVFVCLPPTHQLPT